jgi:2-polyprenyl-3-methyl-5-hydroxy-6-metoxy-1,4-benzoquinol methylase
MINTEKTSITENNIKFYNEHAAEFLQNTVNADMSEWRERFEKHLPDNGRILDAGCGSGRDSKAFMQDGFEVKAFDASEEMCRAAAALTGIEVRKMLFQEVDFCDEFDGIWACASLLHVPYEELPDVMLRLKRALKKDGIAYVSFKYGTEKTTKGERTFSNFTEETVKPLLENAGFEVLEYAVSEDVRPGRAGEKWVNVIAKRW